jgi:hypothetical protein
VGHARWVSRCAGLCVIDSIQSIGQKYGGVKSVVRRYRDFRASQGGDAEMDGAVELAATFEELGGVDGWASKIGTHNRVYSRSEAPLKAAVILDAANLLIHEEVLSTKDLLSLSSEDREDLKRLWLGLRSQRSGISWRYLLMLAGAEGVKPDRMILRFLARHLPDADQLGADEAVSLVTDVARQLGVSANTLDHRIWLHERSRDLAQVTDEAAAGESNGKTMAKEQGQQP